MKSFQFKYHTPNSDFDRAFDVFQTEQGRVSRDIWNSFGDKVKKVLTIQWANPGAQRLTVHKELFESEMALFTSNVQKHVFPGCRVITSMQLNRIVTFLDDLTHSRIQYATVAESSYAASIGRPENKHDLLPVQETLRRLGSKTRSEVKSLVKQHNESVRLARKRERRDLWKEIRSQLIKLLISFLLGFIAGKFSDCSPSVDAGRNRIETVSK